MKLAELHAKQAVAQGRLDAIDATLVRWLNDLRRALGFDHRAPMFDELVVGGPEMALGGSAAMSTFTGTIDQLLFTSGATCSGFFARRLPNSYRPGTAIKPWVDWVPSSTNALNVAWELEHAEGKSASAFGAAATISKTEAAPGALTVKRTEFTDIAGSGLVQGSLVACRLSRMGAAAADTFTGDSWIVAAGFKFEREGAGHEEAHP